MAFFILMWGINKTGCICHHNLNSVCTFPAHLTEYYSVTHATESVTTEQKHLPLRQWTFSLVQVTNSVIPQIKYTQYQTIKVSRTATPFGACDVYSTDKCVQ